MSRRKKLENTQGFTSRRTVAVAPSGTGSERDDTAIHRVAGRLIAGGSVIADWLQRRFPGRTRRGAARSGDTRALLRRGGHALVLCAIVAGAVVDDAGRAIGNVLLVLAMAMALYMLTHLVESPRNWHRAYNLFCVAMMLALFGTLTLMVAVRG